MTRYCSLFRRLLSAEPKGEEADEEEGSAHRESSQQDSNRTAPPPLSFTQTSDLLPGDRKLLLPGCYIQRKLLPVYCPQRRHGPLLLNAAELCNKPTDADVNLDLDPCGT